MQAFAVEIYEASDTAQQRRYFEPEIIPVAIPLANVPDHSSLFEWKLSIPDDIVVPPDSRHRCSGQNQFLKKNRYLIKGHPALVSKADQAPQFNRTDLLAVFIGNDYSLMVDSLVADNAIRQISRATFSAAVRAEATSG
jgi:hypothetical protein